MGWLVGAALVLAAAGPAGAQGAGNGYLFGAPAGRLTLRAGYAFASAGSDVFDPMIEDLTIDRSDFSGPTVGGEIALRVAERFDLTLDLGYASVSKDSHYRELVDTLNNEIEQTTTFRRVPVTANVRAYLVSPGRAVGSLAYIPSKVVPWVGLGAGVTWFQLRQSGAFVQPETLDVYDDTFESSGWGPAAQGMGGVDLTLTPRIAATADARYTWSRATLGGSFEGYDKIDLSGVAVTLGVTFRL